MKYILFLLAAMVGAVSGHEIGMTVTGATTYGGERCSVADQQVLYEECVVDLAVALGWDFGHHRQLELRGNRELLDCGGCCDYCFSHGYDTCACTPKGHYCFTNCQSRRLTIADELVNTETFLFSVGTLEQAANKCLDDASTHDYPCLGDPNDITIQLFLSE
jgi:hypothetical protein